MVGGISIHRNCSQNVDFLESPWRCLQGQSLSRISSLVTGCAQPQQSQGPPSPPSQHRFSRASTFGTFPQRPLLSPPAVTLPLNYSPHSGRTCKMVLKITYCEEQVYAMKQPLQRNIRQIQASCAQILNLWRKKMPLPPLWLFWLKE